MHTRPTDAGMDMNDVYNVVLALSKNIFAFWSDDEESQDPRSVAWHAAAYIRFKSAFEKFYIASEKYPNTIYSFSFETISSTQNAQLQTMVGQQNGIRYLADILMENKENMAFLSNV
jgi:hypothetical protein